MNFSGMVKACQHIEGMTEEVFLNALHILRDQSGPENDTSIMMFLVCYAEMNSSKTMDVIFSNICD